MKKRIVGREVMTMIYTSDMVEISVLKEGPPVALFVRGAP